MTATVITSFEPRLGATPLTHQVFLTNGLELVSLKMTTRAEDVVSVENHWITLTASEAEELAAALIAKATNIRNNIHDNQEGAL